jgi:hypothetical protein
MRSLSSETTNGHVWRAPASNPGHFSLWGVERIECRVNAVSGEVNAHGNLASPQSA